MNHRYLFSAVAVFRFLRAFLVSRQTLRFRGFPLKLNKNKITSVRGKITSQEMKAHVEAGRPVGLYYQIGNYPTGHFVWVAAIHDYLGPNGSPRYLINEPIQGEVTMFYQFIKNRKVITYEQLVAGETLFQLMGYPITVHAKWIATGVGKSQTDP